MQAVGVDIGGTKTALALVAFPEARILRRLEIPTPAGAASGAPFLDEVCAAIRNLVADSPCDAIGLGICELVDRDGAVESAHRVHWRGLPVRERLSAIAPAVVEADVRAAALAECRWGAGRGYRDFLYLNIGTGISTCFVKGGVPHAGARGHALAIASSPVVQSCSACGTETTYVLEDVAGGAGMIARYRAVADASVTSAGEIIDAARNGEPIAVRLIAEAARALGVTLGIALNMLDPEALIVGGGLGGRDGPYFQAMEAAIRKQIWSPQTRALPILRGALGQDAGVIGAATVACLAEEGQAG